MCEAEIRYKNESYDYMYGKIHRELALDSTVPLSFTKHFSTFWEDNFRIFHPRPVFPIFLSKWLVETTFLEIGPGFGESAAAGSLYTSYNVTKCKNVKL